ASELITPIPLIPQYHKQKALLGKKLFFDTRLSADNTISCANCHFLEDGGDDNVAVSTGIYGQKGTRNSPTVLNARYNSVQFWDGSAKDLQDQVNGPVHNPVEMATNFPKTIAKLKKDSQMIKEFNALYDEGITQYSITHAIAEFEKALTTPNSKFDQFLRGDKVALTQDEKKGYTLFKEYGCISCHNGVNIGGNLMQKIGVVEDYETQDLGKFHITNNPMDKYYFKVPSLRNVSLTAPYFHDGRIKTLRDTVTRMVEHQVGYIIQEQEIDYILKFLHTLNGDLPTILKHTP
ncbi:MAG: cytochrome c peroxidase, partial [Campylobacterota bacterium]|nr:cytochrome c peroxidase [Campylobacterota bacterium]